LSIRVFPDQLELAANELHKLVVGPLAVPIVQVG
jgi:hypothetical protein